MHRVVKENPSIGLPLVVQLLGPNGSRDFDRITNTKTVEVILANLSEAQIMEYVQYIAVVFRNGSSKYVTFNWPRQWLMSLLSTDKTSIDSDQRWALEQFSSLIRSATVPKSDLWVTFILNFYVQNGFFVRKVRAKKAVSIISFHHINNWDYLLAPDGCLRTNPLPVSIKVIIGFGRIIISERCWAPYDLFMI